MTAARGLLTALVVAATLAAACSGGDEPPPAADDGAPATTLPTVTTTTVVVGGDRPEPGRPASDDEATGEPEVADAACTSFRQLVVGEVPCGRLVTSPEQATCTRPTGDVIDCSSVPSAARIGQLAGAVVGGQPRRPDIEATQLGVGAGPTNTVLVLFTGAPLPTPAADRLELAVVYDDPGGVTCGATGEAWDGGSFASVLRLGPDEVRVSDLGCRPDGFSEITQRSTWLLAGDLVVVYLPIDLPGAPGRVAGAFRPAPTFAATDGRLATRRLDPAAWDFDDPVEP